MPAYTEALCHQQNALQLPRSAVESFPYFEVRDRENEVVDGSADRADMQELADCMNSLSDYYKTTNYEQE